MSLDERLSSYDYDLPGALIAREPLAARDASRLMVLRRATETIEHRQFAELPELLMPGDLLVINKTRVIPARLRGVRRRTGGRWEGLFLGATGDGCWRLLGQTRGKLQPGEWIDLRPVSEPTAENPVLRFGLQLMERDGEGIWRAAPEQAGDPLAVLAIFGTVPLPPYIGRDVAAAIDWERYQTTYAETPGAVAAPTAGLHFTPQVFERCRQRGIEVASVVLHVGVGTFRPISVERLSEHQMHAEWCELSAATAAALEQARRRGGRVVAVGTTTVRTLESAASPTGEVRPFTGETNLFIRPPYTFRAVDALVTNFHLPRSSLLVLVSAFAGREFMLRAYREAVAQRYRFYSYGDAMLMV
jgi:S-adenosylmethionine:tRNA ribosyltransferase-isomerase